MRWCGLQQQLMDSVPKLVELSSNWVHATLANADQRNTVWLSIKILISC